MESGNKARDLEQSIHELIKKILLMQPVITMMLPANCLTETSENKVHEHLASPCRATDSTYSEITQEKLRAFKNQVFSAPYCISLDMFNNAVLFVCKVPLSHTA